MLQVHTLHLVQLVAVAVLLSLVSVNHDDHGGAGAVDDIGGSGDNHGGGAADGHGNGHGADDDHGGSGCGAVMNLSIVSGPPLHICVREIYTECPRNRNIRFAEDMKTETFQYQVPGSPLHMSRGVKATEPAERGPQMYSGFPSLFLSTRVCTCLCSFNM